MQIVSGPRIPASFGRSRKCSNPVHDFGGSGLSLFLSDLAFGPVHLAFHDLLEMAPS